MLRVGRRITIHGHRSFSYSGPATVFVVGATGRTGVRAQLAFKGRFVLEKSSPFATDVKAAFSSNVCSPAKSRFTSA